MSRTPFIQKLTLRNFRSIRNETVTFANPLFLVGRNGSGKSNFVDALGFLADCMTNPLHSVIERRGGLSRIGHLEKSWASPDVTLRIDFRLNAGPALKGFYVFSFRATADRRYEVIREQCQITSDNNLTWFDRIGSRITSSVSGIQFAASPLSLVIPLVSGIQDFSLMYQSLSALRVYKIDPEQISGIQDQEDEALLKSNSANIASVLERLWKREGNLTQITELLQSIVPGVTPIPPDFAGGKALLYFEQEWPKRKSVFEASAMSSGTLSALGLIVAALQEPVPSLIALEEPELNIHPGALDAIADIIQIASERTQVIITTHSPDLIDAKWIQPENLRVVEWENGATHISELGEAPVKALQQHLMGAGELLRANALDAAPFALASEEAADLFEKDLA